MTASEANHQRVVALIQAEEQQTVADAIAEEQEASPRSNVGRPPSETSQHNLTRLNNLYSVTRVEHR
jgi:hypothetical protein